MAAVRASGQHAAIDAAPCSIHRIRGEPDGKEQGMDAVAGCPTGGISFNCVFVNASLSDSKGTLGEGRGIAVRKTRRISDARTFQCRA